VNDDNATSGTDLPAQPSAAELSTDSSTSRQRRAKIEQLTHEALAEPSAVLANLQLNGSDLLDMSQSLKEAIGPALKTHSEIAELQRLLPMIETVLRLSRQADRLFRLKLDIMHARPTSKK
jgi:hypothetical protein